MCTYPFCGVCGKLESKLCLWLWGIISESLDIVLVWLKCCDTIEEDMVLWGSTRSDGQETSPKGLDLVPAKISKL